MRPVGFAALALIAACGAGERTTAPKLFAWGDFPITVSAGATPQISWPGGNAMFVSVEAADFSPDPLWSVIDTSAAQQGIASPIAEGSVPPGTAPSPTTAPLVRGTHYIASVWRLDGRSALQEFIY